MRGDGWEEGKEQNGRGPGEGFSVGCITQGAVLGPWAHGKSSEELSGSDSNSSSNFPHTQHYFVLQINY